MAAFIRFDGIDGEIPPQADTQPNPPSWGLDRIDQRSLPGDFFGAAPEAQAGYVQLQIMLAPQGEPEPNVEYTLTVTDTQTGTVKCHADPFFAYGDGFLGGVPEGQMSDIGLQIMFAPQDPPAPVDGLVIVTPILDPAAIGLMRAEFIYG